MNTTYIIAILGFSSLLWLLIRRGMETWYRRNEGTGHDVDMESLGISLVGKFEPKTIGNIERMLKEQVEKEEKNSE